MSDAPDDESKRDPAAAYEKIAGGGDPSDPFGDKKFLEKKRAEGAEEAAKLLAAASAAKEIEVLREDVMRLERIDVEKLAAKEGDATRFEYDTVWTPGPDGLPPHCPVAPLGKKRGTFYFLTPDCELIDLAAGNFGQAHIDALFAPQTGYLVAMWGATAQKSGGKRIKYEGVRRNLMDACARKGVFDPGDKVRGRGAWKNALGKLVLHMGDGVIIDGVPHPPGVHGDHVYPARPRLQPILGDGLHDARDGAKKLLTWFECWPWRRRLDARLLLGWVVASLMGAAIDWRPQVMLTGDSGMGKSTLQHLLKAVLGDRLLDVADASAAGLYQTLGYDALGVAFDEFENEDDAKGAAVLRLARLASSGGRVTRGGADGVPTNYQARGAFLFSAINPPAMRPAEQNRTTILALRKPAEGARAPIISNAEAAAIGRMLVARIVHMFSFWPERLDCFRERLAALKHSNRGQDQYGTLLAAADLVLHEGDITSEEWDEIKHELAPEVMGETAGALPNWRRCLNHLLAYQPDGWRAVRFRQVGPALEAHTRRAFSTPDDDKRPWSLPDLRAHLALVGLTLVSTAGDDGEGDVDWLGVPPRHPGLAKMFEATDWSSRRGADGAWFNALAQAPEDVWRRGRFRIGGAREYGLLVRLDAVLERDEDEGDEHN